jgi:hypothetical protein
MAWGFISELAISPEQYDQVDAQIAKDPDGLILHTASRSDGGMRIVDVWESEDAYRRFEAETLMPAVGRLGMPPPSEPPPTTEFAIHNMRGRAA